MADWLPGWERYEYRNLGGKTYQFTHNPKGCIHTTEGSSIAGALKAYAPYPPHGIYDPRNREKLQHVALNRASYSAMDGNDDDYMVQIEIVGYAAESRNWPDEWYRNIAEDVFKPLEDHFGIPRIGIWKGFADGADGINPPPATSISPLRLTWDQLRDFSGWLGHQHLPAPDTHWDPGHLQIEKIFSFMGDDVSLNSENVTVTDSTLFAPYDENAAKVLGAILGNVQSIRAVVEDLQDRVGRIETGGVSEERIAEIAVDAVDEKLGDK